MVRPDRERLHGQIEVDETYIGGSDLGGKRGRGSESKKIVVVAVEVLSPKGFGRIRMRRISDVYLYDVGDASINALVSGLRLWY